MTLGGEFLLCNDDRVADGAVLALGLAGFRAGRLDPCVNDLGVSLGGDFLAILHLLVADGAVGIAGVAILSAGGLLGISHFRVLMCASFAAPDAVDIVDGVASLGGLRLIVGAVGVVQHGGSNGNLMCRHTLTRLGVLIRRGLLAGVTLLVIDAGTGAGADVRAACGGVDAAAGGQRTVNIYFCVK